MKIIDKVGTEIEAKKWWSAVDSYRTFFADMSQEIAGQYLENGKFLQVSQHTS
jgi:hypothetical protein